MSLLEPIHHTFAPHVDRAYLVQSLALLLKPWEWHHGTAQRDLAAEVGERFHGDVTLFASGREALLALLQSLTLRRGDEVIIQGFTCIAVPNAITAAGGKPIYADIERESLNLTAQTVESLIGNRTRAVICQHTFGIPADTEALRELCDQYELPLVEDCAHVMPDETGPRGIGQHGDYLIFSFGRDKAISGIAGGALVERSCHPERVEGWHPPTDSGQAHVMVRRAHHDRFQPLPQTVIVRLLLYPLIYSITKPLYGLMFGKAILLSMRWLGLLVPMETIEEKTGKMNPTIHGMPNACAALALSQLKKLKAINDHRRKLTAFYLEACSKHNWQPLKAVHKELPLQKFPMFIQHAERVRQTLKKCNIHLHDGWSGCVVCPPGVDLDPVRYTPGSDPEAEAACEQILSLPTHPTMTMRQAKRLIRALNTSLQNFEF